MRLLTAATTAAGAGILALAYRHRGWVRRSTTLCSWWVQQRLLRRQLAEHDLVDPAAITLVGGVDISFIKDSETDACAALVVLALPSLQVVYERYERVVLKAPYIPGYLAFREVEFLLTMLNELRASQPTLAPHAVMVDGNGILHPNRFGLASHLGVLAGVPTVGVGKSLHCVDGLTREGVRELARARCTAAGDSVELVGDSGAVWGAALRTTAPSGRPTPDATATFNPVLVSVGHGLSLASSLALVWRCTRHRIPEPVRQADLRSRDWLRTHGAVGAGAGSSTIEDLQR